MGYFIHDIGRTTIPRETIEHDRQLTRKQRESIEMHPSTGLNIVKRLEGRMHTDLSKLKEPIATHHERLDGSGYPNRMKDVPYAGQVCGLADSYVAMISEREHRGSVEPAEAVVQLARDKRYNNLFAQSLGHFVLKKEFG